MNTTIITERNIAVIGTGLAVIIAAVLSISTLTAHAAMISSTLDIGSTGQEVTDLQTYLKANPAWYPSGLITSYFGTLTAAGVEKFQTAQNIVSSGSPESTGYGRVGPLTMNRLNQLMNTGNQSYGATVPVISPLLVQTSQTTLTFSWTTNEPTTGQVYWDVSGIRADEATAAGQIPYVSGNLALDAGGSQTSHIITVSNLVPNTTYYYFVRSIDASGDMTVVLPTSVRTAN